MSTPLTGVANLPFVPGPTPPMIVRGEGNHLITDTGKRILDAGGGAIVTNIGHGRREVAEAAARSMTDVGYVIPPWATPDRVALRDRLVTNWLPAGMDRVGIVSGGSESVDAAIRLAVAHQRASGRDSKWRIIGRRPSYHGATIATLSAGGHDARRSGFDATLLDYPHAPWNDVDALEQTISEADPDTIAAFVAEPIIGAAGAALTPDDDYFTKAADLCARNDILFIADEVMTGFGRCGSKFGYELFGAQPDILVGSKGLSGGYAAMGGVYATQEVVAPLEAANENFMYFTYSGHSAACAVANAVLQIMEDEKLVERAAVQGQKLNARLVDEFADHPHVSDIRGRGLLIGLELVAERNPHAWFPADAGFKDQVVGQCLERGVWVYPAGSGEVVQDAILLGPPFTITDDEIDQLVAVLRQAIDAAAKDALK
ncbi:MAG: adenosylmethionine-8-amino-7-oxononanoate aminotransferase [Candidatus Poriferisodalaceae bacterium]|jgi:adenosylmethionine-8-amino-7-oxononanoate aminotransferase